MTLQIQNTLKEAAIDTIPRKTRYPRSVPWWTRKLSLKKKQVNRLRRQKQRMRDDDAWQERQEAYTKARKEYSKLAAQTRILSWRAFVKKDSADNPFGITYRICREKKSISAITSVKTDAGYTDDCLTTTKATLTGLFGEEVADPHEESRASVPSMSLVDAPPWSQHEVYRAIRRMRNGKAPGIDMVETEMLKQAAQGGLLPHLTQLFNACLKLGVFPTVWKTGVVRILLKSKDKDPSEVKSYRPICLLNIISKVLERLIRGRLEAVILDPAHATTRQFGFRAGRGTEDAIAELKRMKEEAEEPIVLALLFDVSGAFDNLLWSSVLRALRTRSCPNNIYRLIADYLSARRVAVIEGVNAMTRRIFKGCPQGSILGPDFWNVVFDELLCRIEDLGGELIAYADDLAIIIKGNSRRDIERKGQLMMDTVLRWCEEQGLKISPTKSEMIVLKDGDAGRRTGKRVTAVGSKRLLQAGSLSGSLVHPGAKGRRPPTIKISGRGMRYADTARYLGVTIGTRFVIGEHLHTVGAKAKRVMNRLGTLARATWGIDHWVLKRIYSAVFVPIVLYAAGAWGDLASSHLKKLGQIQRAGLLPISRAYRTVSTHALQVLNAELPLDLLIKERWYRYKVRKKQPFTFEAYHYDGQEEASNAYENIRNALLNVWENRWQASAKGRETYGYFPSVRQRTQKCWVELTHFNMQFLTGHGDFKQKLHGFGLVDSPLCTCGAEESAFHVLMECGRYNAQRADMRQLARRKGLAWPMVRDNLVADRESFVVFTKCSRLILEEKRRLEMERTP